MSILYGKTDECYLVDVWIVGPVADKDHEEDGTSREPKKPEISDPGRGRHKKV